MREQGLMQGSASRRVRDSTWRFRTHRIAPDEFQQFEFKRQRAYFKNKKTGSGDSGYLMKYRNDMVQERIC